MGNISLRCEHEFCTSSPFPTINADCPICHTVYYLRFCGLTEIDLLLLSCFCLVKNCVLSHLFLLKNYNVALLAGLQEVSFQE